MPLASLDELVCSLQESNQRLSYWLDCLVPCPGTLPATTRVASPEQMSGLLSELRRVGEYLKAMPARKDRALEHELAQYRRHVERVRDVLPSIHAALLRERARLEQERARVDAAAQWARSSRQTL